MSAFKLQYMLLADAAQPLGKGKLNILGTFDQVHLKSIPTRYAGFVVIALVIAETEDALGDHRFAIRLLRPNGQAAGEWGGTATLKPAGEGPWLSSVRLVLQIGNVPFREYGRHKVVVVMDEDVVGEHALLVSAPQADG